MNATAMKRAPQPVDLPSPTGDPSGEPQTLSSYIQSRFDECSRSQKDVAQYIIDHLDEAAFQTAEELARRANTSSSTVVRFSQALGFEGFPELQRAAREEYRHAHGSAGTGTRRCSAVERSDFETRDRGRSRERRGDRAQGFGGERRTARSPRSDSASRIVIAGTDQMAFFASYLRHLLMLLDLRAELVASPSQEALGRLARIDEETLVIALSAGRPHALVVRAMKLARHRNAATIAITDATLSDVAKLAEIKLYYSSNSPAYVRSHTALLSLIQALAYGVYSRDEEQYVERIKAFRLK